ncbi:hypothetical protein [Streptomyces sp. AS02]|uniref:hypothetical protein n=1 Tax=Streptomyces sp. AS02 TaxID=2938946 RepID=UPI0020210C09|nr:hypothetical protein [Streptomyces sp. AS02]MCL8015934.1 hypothetical protein [Streptomyces sp. AS02]
METQFAGRALRDPRAGEICISDWRDRWWNGRVVKPHTLWGDASSIRNHVPPHWAAWEVRAIARMDVRSRIRALVEKGAGASAVQVAYNLTS